MKYPRISINLAISADGKISSSGGIASGWTSDDDFARLKVLRQSCQALMVGRGTLEKDCMTLQAPQNPLRCVVSRSGNFEGSHPLFSTQGGPIHLLGTEAPPSTIAGTTAHQMSLPDFLGILHTHHGVNQIHCEGGGQLIHHLAALDLIEEIHLTWAGHRVFGGENAPTLTGIPGNFLPHSRPFELTDIEPRNELGECFLSYRRRNSPAAPTQQAQ
ncbi:MAG: RibD family protein [Verrucomicrobiales bacterium]